MFKIPSLPVVSEKVNKDETLKEFSMKDIEKGKILGGGSFGTTFITKFNGKEVALKQLHGVTTKFQNLFKKRKLWVALCVKILSSF